jgi:hypothetical protein
VYLVTDYCVYRNGHTSMYIHNAATVLVQNQNIDMELPLKDINHNACSLVIVFVVKEWS